MHPTKLQYYCEKALGNILVAKQFEGILKVQANGVVELNNQAGKSKWCSWGCYRKEDLLP